MAIRCDKEIRETVHVGAIGLELLARLVDDGVAVDISAATTLEIILKAPTSGTVKTLAAAIVDGPAGTFSASTSAGTLDEYGDWLIQGRVVTPGWDLRTEQRILPVGSNL